MNWNHYQSQFWSGIIISAHYLYFIHEPSSWLAEGDSGLFRRTKSKFSCSVFVPTCLPCLVFNPVRDIIQETCLNSVKWACSRRFIILCAWHFHFSCFAFLLTFPPCTFTQACVRTPPRAWLLRLDENLWHSSYSIIYFFCLTGCFCTHSQMSPSFKIYAVWTDFVQGQHQH